MDITQDLITSYFNSIPEHLQKKYLTPNNHQVIKSLARKYGITAEQEEDLENIVLMVLLGMIHPENLEAVVENQLRISEDFAVTLTLDIDENIVSPVKKDLIEVYNDRNDDNDFLKILIEFLRNLLLPKNQILLKRPPKKTRLQ
jgi:hypothetical protein